MKTLELAILAGIRMSYPEYSPICHPEVPQNWGYLYALCRFPQYSSTLVLNQLGNNNQNYTKAL